MNDGKDRREAKRISYVCEVECEASGLNRLATRLTDPSRTGAFIDSVNCYSPGTILRLKFSVRNVLIETAAEVRYTMPQMGMGVQFLDLKPEYEAVLESLIEDKPLPQSVPPPDAGHSLTAPSNPELLVGNFAVVSMLDVIQLIENNHLGGTLEVTSQTACGEIHFNEGQIVGARESKQTGVEALKRFLDVTEGRFEFKRSPTSNPRTIEASSNSALMMDLLRHG